MVANVPGRNSIAVAELTLALLLAVDRAVPDNVAELRAGQWDKKRFSQVGRGLYGRSLGIVGLGHIGLEVAARARAFGLDLVTLARPRRSEATRRRIEELDIAEVPSLLDVAGRVDVLTLHLPLTDETRGSVGEAVLDALAPGVLINTSRAAVVDTDALLAHLDRGHALGRPGRLSGRAGGRRGALDLQAGRPPAGRRDAPHRGVHRAGPVGRRRRCPGGRRRLRQWRALHVVNDVDETASR